MKQYDHKTRQAIYHKVSTPPDYDDGKAIIEQIPDRIVERAVDYFYKDYKKLYYPAKSYAVAIIYAKLLEKNFGIDFYEALDDKGLLYGNDKYFVPYQKSVYIYDKIIENIPDDFLSADLPNVRTTINYFHKEFLLDTNPVAL